MYSRDVSGIFCESLMISITHNGPESIRLGVVAAENMDARKCPIEMESRLDRVLKSRRGGLIEEEDAWRRSVRDILRNGRYKPTGRGKPASEYLLRAASEDAFPRINAIVDICNYISLYSLMPVSIWDIDRARTHRFVVRLGREDESYAFNDAQQSIALRDLVIGCGIDGNDPLGVPLVSPIKDSVKTKTSDRSRNVAAIVYAPLTDGPMGSLEEIVTEFRVLLAMCGEDAHASEAIVLSGETVGI